MLYNIENIKKVRVKKPKVVKPKVVKKKRVRKMLQKKDVNITRKRSNNYKKDTNFDYDRNHALILDAIMSYLHTDGKFPTFVKLAEMTKLNYETIRNHAKDFNWNDFLPKYKLYAPKLMENILSTARKNSSSQRLGAEILGMVSNNQVNQILIQNINEVPQTEAAILAMENYLDELHKQKRISNGSNGSGGNGNGHK